MVTTHDTNQRAQPMRWLRHLTMTSWQLRRAFPETALQAITDSVRASELQHGGEIRVAIEADLATAALWRGQSTRQRALEVFATLGVWDTDHRNGVLLYLCMADRRVEIVADRGLVGKVDDAQWAAVCRQLERDCASGNFSGGVCAAVTAIGNLLGQHFPSVDRNELSDRPVLF